MLKNLIQVAIGGALGSTLRYLVGLGAVRLFGTGFPVGTLVVNVAGSFVMGLLYGVLSGRGAMHLAPLLLAGVLGGFTTFSAFSLDTVTLWERGQVTTAVLYVLVSVLVSLAALWAGLVLARGELA